MAAQRKCQLLEDAHLASQIGAHLDDPSRTPKLVVAVVVQVYHVVAFFFRRSILLPWNWRSVILVIISIWVEVAVRSESEARAMCATWAGAGTGGTIGADLPRAIQGFTLGTHKIGYSDNILPVLSILANSHLGLVYIQREWRKVQSWMEYINLLHVTETLTAVHSWYGHVVFKTNALIAPMQELIV